ncbi:hypothetical protein AMTRI_Chr06g174110 [Amborella trichopoda]
MSIFSIPLDVMRRYGVPEPYEKLKELTKDRAVTKESMQEFVRGLQLPHEFLSTLLNLTPHTYIGAARDLAINFLFLFFLRKCPSHTKCPIFFYINALRQYILWSHGAPSIHALEPQCFASCIGRSDTKDTTLQQYTFWRQCAPAVSKGSPAILALEPQCSGSCIRRSGNRETSLRHSRHMGFGNACSGDDNAPTIERHRSGTRDT